jgi:SH3 domain protein
MPGTRNSGRHLTAAGWIAATLIALAPSANAETVYVIDKLLVGVHAEKTLDSTIVKTLPTGTALEVLKREGDMAKIKGPAGIIGWVDAVYLTKEQPAALLVPKLEEQNRKLVEELKEAQHKVESATAELESARRPADPATAPAASGQELARLETEADNLQRALETERNRNGELQAKLTALQGTTPADASALAELTQENAALKQDLEEAQIKAIRAAEAAPQAAAFSAFNWSNSLPLPAGVLAFIALALLLSSFMAGIWFMDARQRRRLGGLRL